MAVPYTFGSATTSIPLSQLDSNFATTITLGNTAIQLGNTVTTLNNMTLGNVTVSSGSVVAGIVGPAFSAYQSSSQSISAGTVTKLQLQSEDFDTANAFDSTTNYRFQPTVAGYYLLTGTWGTSLSSFLNLYIYKTNVQFKLLYTNYTSPSYGGAGSSAIVYLNGSTDYAELWAYSSAACTVTTGTANTYFTGCLVRTA